MIAPARTAQPERSIRSLCEATGASRSWWYAHPAATAPRDAIERIVLECPGYGYRRVAKTLQRDGTVINHKRVLRVMREESLLCQLERRFVRPTDSADAWRTYPNLVAGLVPERADQVWVADITYIRLPTTFAYLACVLDGWSRRCVGWELSRTIATMLTLSALGRALARRRPEPGLIHHSDRGVRYASAGSITRLQGASAQVSMSAVGSPYDNAKAESFFKTLQTGGRAPEQRPDVPGRWREPCPVHRGGVQREATAFKSRLSAADRIRSERRFFFYEERELTMRVVRSNGGSPGLA